MASTVLLNIAEMGKLHTEVGKFLPGAKCSSRVPFVKSRVSVTESNRIRVAAILTCYKATTK